MPESDRQLLALLAPTVYACSSLAPLAGGSVSGIYRGTLRTALQDGSTSIVVRQCDDETRYAAEAAFLQTIKDSQSSTFHFQLALDGDDDDDAICVQVGPVHLHACIPEARVQLAQDLVGSQLLKAFLLSPSPSPPGAISASTIGSVGEAIGRWLAAFHAWGRQQVQNDDQVDRDLLAKLRRNEDLHCKEPSPLYGAVADQCEDEGARQAVRTALRERDERVQGVIHGDFSARNILIDYSAGRIELTVIDWETVTYENQLHDVANMLAVIYIQDCLSGVPSFASLLHGFLRGYRALDTDLAANAMVLTGVWMLFFRQIMLQAGGSDPQDRLKNLALDLISKGAKEDKEVGDGVGRFQAILAGTREREQPNMS